jgi:hypothetical protein
MTVPILSPGISSLVSTNAMAFIINLVRSSEVSALFFPLLRILPSFAALTPSLQGGFPAAVFVFFT